MLYCIQSKGHHIAVNIVTQFRKIVTVTIVKFLKNNLSALLKECSRVACKRRSSVNSGAWLQRFDDVTRVEKSCVAKSKKK